MDLYNALQQPVKQKDQAGSQYGDQQTVQVEAGDASKPQTDGYGTAHYAAYHTKQNVQKPVFPFHAHNQGGQITGNGPEGQPDNQIHKEHLRYQNMSVKVLGEFGRKIIRFAIAT